MAFNRDCKYVAVCYCLPWENVTAVNANYFTAISEFQDY